MPARGSLPALCLSPSYAARGLLGLREQRGSDAAAVLPEQFVEHAAECLCAAQLPLLLVAPHGEAEQADTDVELAACVEADFAILYFSLFGLAGNIFLLSILPKPHSTGPSIKIGGQAAPRGGHAPVPETGPQEAGLRTESKSLCDCLGLEPSRGETY